MDTVDPAQVIQAPDLRNREVKPLGNAPQGIAIFHYVDNLFFLLALSRFRGRGVQFDPQLASGQEFFLRMEIVPAAEGPEVYAHLLGDAPEGISAPDGVGDLLRLGNRVLERNASLRSPCWLPVVRQWDRDEKLVSDR